MELSEALRKLHKEDEMELKMCVSDMVGKGTDEKTAMDECMKKVYPNGK